MENLKFKGTGGEWSVFNERQILEGRESLAIESDNNKSVVVFHFDVSNNPQEELANAKLMAASPKLLKALQDCLSTLNIIDDTIEVLSDHQTYFNSTRNSIEVAEKAIEKALK